MVKVAVLGAGINGLASATRIKEKYKDFEVAIISNKFSPDTTGDGSGGLWNPYFYGETSEVLLTKWGLETYRFLHKHWLESGQFICMMPVNTLHRIDKDVSRPVWADHVFGYQEIDKKHLDYINRSAQGVKYISGQTFNTFVVHPPSMLSKLTERFIKAGGVMKQYEVTSLEDPLLKDFDIVINCTGLGARKIVPDSKVFPIRGQITRVIAPWINESIIDEDSGNYIIPSILTCVLGGTHQEHNYSTVIDHNDADFVMNGCMDIKPILKHAKLVLNWVGLRPGRDAVRLESEVRDGKLYIHNYGHGGSGFTLFWGCAADVVELLDKSSASNKSKL